MEFGPRLFLGLLLIAIGVFHIWVREGVSETYRAMRRSWIGQGHTPRASVLQGCAMIGVGLLIIFGF